MHRPLLAIGAVLLVLLGPPAACRAAEPAAFPWAIPDGVELTPAVRSGLHDLQRFLDASGETLTTAASSDTTPRFLLLRTIGGDDPRSTLYRGHAGLDGGYVLDMREMAAVNATPGMLSFTMVQTVSVLPDGPIPSEVVQGLNTLFDDPTVWPAARFNLRLMDGIHRNILAIERGGVRHWVDAQDLLGDPRVTRLVAVCGALRR